jgi:hypothetical protein
MLVSTTIVVLPIESSISISYQAYLYILDIYSMRNIYVIYMSYTILGKMSQSYSKSCMFCKKEIVMSDRGAGKWLPYSLNVTVHEYKIKKPVQKIKVQKDSMAHFSVY